MICKYFLEVCGLSFHSVNSVFQAAVSSLIKCVSFFSFMHTFYVLRNLCVPELQRFFPVFSSVNIIVLGFTFRSIILISMLLLFHFYNSFHSFNKHFIHP